MDATQQEAIKLKLDRLLNKGNHFSICDIDSLGSLMGSNPESSPHYKTLKALHCVKYSEMSEELKTKLPEIIMSVLSSKFSTDLMAKALCAVHSGEIKEQPNIEDFSPNVYSLTKKK